MRIFSYRHTLWFLIEAMVVMGFMGVGCQTTPQKRAAEDQLIAMRDEVPLDKQLTKNIIKAYGASEHQLLKMFTGELVKSLSPSSQVEVHVLASPGFYAAAGFGNTIYISIGILKMAEYENELAFLLATLIVLTKDRATSHSLTQFESQTFGESLAQFSPLVPYRGADIMSARWFEPGGLFDYGADTYLKADRDAVRLMYGAKYDTRGVVTFLQRLAALRPSEAMGGVGKIWADPEERLRQAREEVAKLSPLRDPIVKSRRFDEFKDELANKKTRKAEKPSHEQRSATGAKSRTSGP